MYVIGVDTGPIPGIVRLQLDVSRPGENLVANGAYLRDAQALQVTPDLIEPVLDMLAQDDKLAAIAVERFVVGRRASRSATAAAGATTRDMVGIVTGWASSAGVQCIARAAADVKPWATDRRLEAAGLLKIAKGMRHARDGARHALFCAVKDYGLPDPLSRKAGTR
jgi:hypothetical protein